MDAPLVSTTAEWGDYVSGPRVINDQSHEQMHEILAEIQDGPFARAFMDEWESGAEQFAAYRNDGRNHQIEQVGRQVRATMPWLDDGQTATWCRANAWTEVRSTP